MKYVSFVVILVILVIHPFTVGPSFFLFFQVIRLQTNGAPIPKSGQLCAEIF